ncbi:MAG TPA: M3 family metallopeptidase [Xanthobacteraceae bacterium]|jgi:peptidyl-dipeptidase Dcp|nr:M3 family metallopeptidase [Xanthobacteraceae bacterium]
MPDNPLLAAWPGPDAVPPFGHIEPAHFRPALERAMAEQREALARVAADAVAPSFDNTVAAMERSGRTLARVENVFSLIAGADADAAIMAIEREVAPLIAAHRNAVFTDAALFRRFDELHARRADLGLTAEQQRVLERYHLAFRRAGAGLDEGGKRRLAEIVRRLAALGTAFGQNVLADEQGYALPLEPEDVAGLPEFVRAATKRAAEERGLAGHVVTIGRSSVEPFLQFSARRDLREKLFAAWVARGDGGAHDNNGLIAEMVALRAEQARLLGYPSFADYVLADTMAKAPGAARGLLDKVWAAARPRALAERDALQAIVHAEGGNFRLAPWDWRYYAEKLRKARHDLDEADLKPYLGLDNIIDAAFFTAERLFGLTFAPRTDVRVWRPEVRVWEVRGPGGYVGLFFGDYFARPTKRSGAWMTTLRDREKLTGDVRPLVINVMNFAKAADGDPTLLSFEDARTLFHEFGHALHALLSDVTYPMIAGTAVPGDFVELPSQLYEHWLARPEILQRFALHHRTGEPMPAALMARLIASRNFNQGFMTTEYLGSAFVDLDFHDGRTAADAGAVEVATRAHMAMPDEIVLRHRPPHFQHVFAGEGGYAAGYYSYLWSEVLDADAFAAFEAAGDVFDPALARRLRDYVYAAGNSRDPAEAYRAFRGALPGPEALLRKRGLVSA